jgi:hypothetical protein
MILRSIRLDAWTRGVMVTLAALALAVRVLIPQGYMAPSQPGAAFALVICTDHGLITLDDKPVPPGKSRTDSPCAFSGNLAAAAPPLATLARFEVWSSAPPRVEIRRDLAPGRGLAAPPPPAIGPPTPI